MKQFRSDPRIHPQTPLCSLCITQCERESMIHQKIETGLCWREYLILPELCWVRGFCRKEIQMANNVRWRSRPVNNLCPLNKNLPDWTTTSQHIACNFSFSMLSYSLTSIKLSARKQDELGSKFIQNVYVEIFPAISFSYLVCRTGCYFGSI